MEDHRTEPESADDAPSTKTRTPIFNLPGILLATLCLLGVIYAIQSLVLPGDAVDWLFFNFGFIPARYVVPFSEQGPQWLWSPVTYSLLHGSVEHILFNGLWLMAFGAPVVRRIGAPRYVLFWIFSSVASAALHAGLNWGDPTLLIGASGVVSALMGAACRFAFPPERRMPRPAHLNPRLSVMESFRSRTVLVFTAFWLIGNGLIAVGIPLIGDPNQPIAWDAHIGGFIFGFFLFPLFDRNTPAEPEGSEAHDILQS